MFRRYYGGVRERYWEICLRRWSDGKYTASGFVRLLVYDTCCIDFCYAVPVTFQQKKNMDTVRSRDWSPDAVERDRTGSAGRSDGKTVTLNLFTAKFHLFLDTF